MADEREDRLEQLVHDDYRRTPAASADLRARILRGLDDHDAAAVRGAVWQWWWRPGGLRLAPAAALAIGCVLIAAGAWIGSAGFGRTWKAPNQDSGTKQLPPGVPAEVATAGASDHAVAFMLVAPGVTHVALVGEFNDWDPLATPLVQVGRDGPWIATVPLPPGRHIYGFVLDGSRWMSDPRAPLAPDDGFGAPNSVVVVGQEGPL